MLTPDQKSDIEYYKSKRHEDPELYDMLIDNTINPPENNAYFFKLQDVMSDALEHIGYKELNRRLKSIRKTGGVPSASTLRSFYEDGTGVSPSFQQELYYAIKNHVLPYLGE